MVASDERYLLMKNGKFFSTGNHPVETLLPMYHLDRAGFDIDIATLSGNPVKLEMWAMPHEDAVVPATFQKYLAQFKKPLKLADVLKNSLGDDSPYLAVLIPGGHGALIGLPDSEDLKTLLKWAVAKDKFVISLCHGPAGLLAAAVNEAPENYIFKGYKMCVFPDALDQGANLDIGYSQTTLLSIQDSKKNRNNSSTDLYWFYSDLTIYAGGITMVAGRSLRKVGC